MIARGPACVVLVITDWPSPTGVELGSPHKKAKQYLLVRATKGYLRDKVQLCPTHTLIAVTVQNLYYYQHACTPWQENGIQVQEAVLPWNVAATDMCQVM